MTVVMHDWATGDVVGLAEEGHLVKIDHDYLAGPLEVEKTVSQTTGRALIVSSSGGGIYRLRQDSTQKDLLLEKYQGTYAAGAAAYDIGNWDSHLRVKARIIGRASDDGQGDDGDD